MAFHIHRAERTDLLADGLGALLADPLPDPFAEELVIVPAKGVERWLSQRLSHILGRGTGQDGVCAGISFRNPRSLIAEITGTDDDDPWHPDTLVWPLLEVIDDSCDDGWCKTLATHLGHFEAGEEKELRQGRRYAVARRLAGLFASYARQRPQLLIDWENGTADGLDADLEWQPHLWRALLDRVDADPPHIRHAKTVATLQESPTDLPERISLFGHTRLPSTEIELLDALSTHHDLHLWLPHPSDNLWQSLAGVHGQIPRRDDTSHREVGPSAAGHPRPRPSRTATQPARQTRRPTNTYPIGWRRRPPRHAAGLAAVRHHRERRAAATAERSGPTTARCRCTAATARPAKSTFSARFCSACSPTTRRSSPATSSSCARTSRPMRR